MANAGYTMLIFSVASWVMICRFMEMLIPTKFILTKETSFEHNCFILYNIYQNINKMESGFPPTSGPSDWPN